MAERIVINTGPLIALASSDVIDIVGKLPYEFFCPQEVRNELDNGQTRAYLKIKPTWLTVLPCASPLHPVAVASLDVGEAAVIQLAMEQGIGRVCIDESKGRRTAQAVGLKVTGALGLLARAKTLGLVPALAPLVERMIHHGAWYDPELVRRVLAGVGE